MPADPTKPPDEKAESVIRNNRGIVIVVATLGALIILAVGAMIYGIMTKSGKHSDAPAIEQTDAAPSNPQPAPITGLGTILEVNSQPGRLYLHIRTKSGAEILRIYDENGILISELEP